LTLSLISGEEPTVSGSDSESITKRFVNVSASLTSAALYSPEGRLHELASIFREDLIQSLLHSCCNRENLLFKTVETSENFF